MKQTFHPAVVVIGYNRPDSLLRLLNSLEKADYPQDPVTLVICLDYSEKSDCRNVARDFSWSHGTIVHQFQTERQGLRKHVLLCGDLTAQYGSIVMLEDDIVVSPAFYEYAVEAQEAYKDNDRVAGVALYSHQFNFLVKAPFEPIPTGQSTFFLQFPCSWGQSWTASQWSQFSFWFANKAELHGDLPPPVRKWPEASWLKWFASYCLAERKTWVYPYQSLATNFGEAGTNSAVTTTVFQVALVRGSRSPWIFASLEDCPAQYDQYFENCSPALLGVIPDRDWEMDAYGAKPINQYRKPFMITSRSTGSFLQGFSLRFKPFEANIFEGTSGTMLVLAPTASFPKANKRLSFVLFSYLYANRFTARQLIRYGLNILGIIKEKSMKASSRRP